MRATYSRLPSVLRLARLRRQGDKSRAPLAHLLPCKLLLTLLEIAETVANATGCTRSLSRLVVSVKGFVRVGVTLHLSPSRD